MAASSLARGALIGLAVLLVLGCSRPATPLPAVPQPSPTPAPPVSLPRDAAAHDALTEWWYYTGHLSTDAGAEYGFEFTIFQVRRIGAPTGYLAHFAVTDVDGQRFSHQARSAQGDPQTGLLLDVGGWRLTSDGTSDEIAALMDAAPGAEPPFGLRLRLRDEKPPALHNGGYIEYGPAGGSYYYSRTRLAVSGELSVDGATAAVTGAAWMDHQWGNFLVVGGGAGWDWYSLQLDDRSELMLYVLRGPGGETSAVYGTHVLPDGATRELEADAVRVEVLDTWTSPHTGTTYPSGWRLHLPERTLRVEPRVRDQELYFPALSNVTQLAAAAASNLTYWEGAVSVIDDASHQPLGRGYIELTGYAH